jgi:hypothetical protein
MEGLHFLSPATIRVGYTHPMDDGQQRSFKVRFEGEGADDYGGPFRECFAQMVQELQATSSNASGFGDAAAVAPGGDAVPEVGDGGGGGGGDAGVRGDSGSDDGDSGGAMDAGAVECMLPLLVPCPNRVAGVGANRELFLLRPCVAQGGDSGVVGGAFSGDMHWVPTAAPGVGRRAPMVLTPALRQMYRFLGRMIGTALRNRVQIPLLLEPSFWKALVAAPRGLADIAAVDTSLATFLSTLRRTAAQCVADGYVAADDAVPGFEDLTWTTRLGDGSEVLLRPDGAALPVLCRDVDAYADSVVRARLSESAPAMRAVVDGFASVVPAAVLPLMTGRELELLVCGSGDVDVDLLYKNTEYDEDGTLLLIVCAALCVGVGGWAWFVRRVC